jgi:cobalt-precorrin 5A hydrolase/precorrin-3B C17-methyltransferase
MKPGLVTFAGAGPGAVDLLTLRARDAIAAADVIVYAGSLVNPATLAFARDDAAIHDSAAMTLEETTAVLVTACRAGQRALRLHTGDPALYGAIAEQIVALEAEGIDFDVIPGVTAAFAAAATLGCELTLPGASQTLILTRRAGRTPVPAGQDIASLATHGATLGIYLSVGDMPGLVADLQTGGYPASTPVAVVYRASWDDEQRVRGTLADIAERVTAAGITRQALILVGDALTGLGERSRLYAPDFAHGYRGVSPDVPVSPTPPAIPTFLGSVAVYGLTNAGCTTARQLAESLNATAYLSAKHADEGATTSFEPSQLGELLAAQWHRYDAHVLVMASGIAVRKIAPLLADKTTDPAVLVCDEAGHFAVSLTSGHLGGANRLCRQVAALSGATPVITTATDVQGLPAFDEIAALQGWEILNPAAIKHVNNALLERQPIGFTGPAAVLAHYYAAQPTVRVIDGDAPPAPDLRAIVSFDAPPAIADTGAGEFDIPVMHLRSHPLIVGIGCRRDTPAAEIAAAVDGVFAAHGLATSRVIGVGSATIKQDEPGLLEFVEQRGLELHLFEAAALDEVAVPTPSPMPAKHVGTASVAEAAALLASAGRLLVPKQICGQVTVAVAVATPPAPATPGKIYAVGIGSGALDTITPQAQRALRDADVIVGYRVYTDQIAPLVPGTRILASGMRKEVDRCRAAIAEATAGATVAMVCSGDAGVYGMSGLLLQLLADAGEDAVELEVVPGLTAALGAAAALGAPLMNDFAIISLSDLLTAREVIIKRLKAVASAGMPCALYNPRSRKRTELLDEACAIFAAAAPSDLACGFVKNAGRPGETTWMGSLSELPVEEVDMFTTVIIGGAETTILRGQLVTPRGYKARGKV